MPASSASWEQNPTFLKWLNEAKEAENAIAKGDLASQDLLIKNSTIAQTPVTLLQQSPCILYAPNTPKYINCESAPVDKCAKVTIDNKQDFIADDGNKPFAGHDFILPGMGHKTNDDCGTKRKAIKCPRLNEDELIFEKMKPKDEKHTRFTIHHWCHKAACPVCHGAWATRAGNDATERILAGWELYLKAGKLMGLLHHYSFSPPQEWAIELMRTKEGYRKLREALNKVLKIAGLRGGVAVFHPWRPINHNLPEDLKYQPNNIKISPHFHIVGVGFLMFSPDFYKETGWTYHKIKPRKGFRDPAKTIQYIVSYQSGHAGIMQGIQTVTYFGYFSTRNLSKEPVTKIRETIKCKLCGTELHLVTINEDLDGNQKWHRCSDLGIYIHKVKKTKYKIRIKETTKQTKL